MMDKYLAVLKDFLSKPPAAIVKARLLDLCAVAAGRLDGFFEFNLKRDIAAGALIVQEAGGIVTDYVRR